MTTPRRRAAVTILAMVVAHALIAALLDRAPGAPMVLTVVAVAALLVLRLALVFVVPGWLLARAIEAALRRDGT